MKFKFKFFIHSQKTQHQSSITAEGDGDVVAENADAAARHAQDLLMRDFAVARYEVAIKFT